MTSPLRSTLVAASLFSLALNLVPIFADPVLAAGSHSGGHGHAADIGKPGNPEDASRTVQIGLHDNYYEPESISVKEGETIRFVLENRGELVHEFNIGTATMHEAHQDEMAMMVEHGVIDGDQIHHHMMKMDMGNGQTMEHDDPNSVLLEPGQSAEIVWTFSTDAELEFACNLPGHYESGMMGSINIEH